MIEDHTPPEAPPPEDDPGVVLGILPLHMRAPRLSAVLWGAVLGLSLLSMGIAIGIKLEYRACVEANYIHKPMVIEAPNALVCRR